MAKEKPMREAMPVCCAFVDAMRDAGLTDDATIKAGLKNGRCWFMENGNFIGQPGARERSEQESARAIKGDALQTSAVPELTFKGRRKA